VCFRFFCFFVCTLIINCFIFIFHEENLVLCFVFCFCVFGGLVYSGLVLGLAGLRKFRALGALRAVVQSLRFEVCLVFIRFRLIFFCISFANRQLIYFGWQNIFFCPLVVVCFYLVFLVELNRSPFDFVEGESELVSGFNTEYFGGIFALIFIGEYFLVLVLTLVLVLWFVFWFKEGFYFVLVFGGLGFRCFFPRYRYDKIVLFFWGQILVLIGSLLLFVVGVSRG